MPQEADIVESLIRSVGRRIEPPGDAYRQVHAAALEAFRAKAARLPARSWIAYAGAAAALVAAVLVVLRGNAPIAPERELASVARVLGGVEIATGDDWQPAVGARHRLTAGTKVRTLADGRAALALAGGQSLRLAAGTEIMLDAPGRLYARHGTIYIDSGAGRAQSGVEVVTSAGTARDVGTQFELRVEGARLRLRVREGSVVVDRGGRSMTGRAGEELDFDDFGRVSRAAIAADAPAWQWAEAVAPVPDIDGRPASQLIAWVARETGRQLRYDSAVTEQRAASVILHGDIRHLPPMAALEAMLATTDLECVLEGDTMEIRTRYPQTPAP